MPTLIRPSGVRVHLPEPLAVAPETAPPAVRGATRGRVPGAIPMPGTPESVATSQDEADRLARALADQDLELLDVISIEPAPPSLTTRGAPLATEVETPLEIPVGADESAVILTEQDGLYAWHFPDRGDAPPAESMPGRSRGPGDAGRSVVVRLRLRTAAAQPEGRARGWISDLALERARVFVFKFAGRFLLDRLTQTLERGVRPGLVVVRGPDPTQWATIPNASALTLPDQRTPRILLLVHGTFSTTRGAFGGLAATPWGRALLSAFEDRYDAVIGVDHPTLSVDPLVNAKDLLSRLEARPWPRPPVIDVICHSRGGLTVRSLVEHLLPSSALRLNIGRVIFVGAVNGGTELANPDNWQTLIDLYTNLAAGACRAMALFPHTAFTGVLLGELVQSLGAFAKVLATQTLAEGALPGLAAMSPQGPFVQEINRAQPGQPAAANCAYYAVTSEFSARVALEKPRELPRQLLLALGDGLVDQLMGRANDLVVNTDSMVAIDPLEGAFIKDSLEFGPNGVVYHTNYFLQPQVTEAIARWLDLQPTEGPSPIRLRGYPGAVVRQPAPARLNTSILVAAADEEPNELLSSIRRIHPSYVVIERPWSGTILRYAFQAGEALERLAARPAPTVADALELHEIDASSQGAVDDPPPIVDPASSVTARRYIGIDDGVPAGVAEATTTPLDLDQLVARAKEQTAVETGVHPPRRDEFETSAPPPAPAPAPPSGSGATPEPPPRRRGIPKTDQPAAVTPAPAEPRPPAPPRVACHAQAEMDDEIVVGQTASIDVTISREEIAAAAPGRASGSGSVALSEDRKLIIDLIPKKNVLPVGDTRVEIDAPPPGEPAQVVFDIQGACVGDGEILVRLRQGAQPLLGLRLLCRIVDRRSRAPRRQDLEASVVEPAPIRQPLHQLTIFEIERGSHRLYQYILDSPSLGWKHTYESRPFTGSREDFIRGIYEDIEQRWLSNRDDFDQFQLELREIGGNLWDELFPADLQRALWDRRQSLQGILVFSEEPFIPWELVHFKEPGKPLGPETHFFGQAGLVRWQHNIGWPTETLRARAGRCRHIIPHYPHPQYALPEAEAEAEFLEERFQATAIEPRPAPVRKALADPDKWDLLHFACHGVADSGDIARAELLLEGRVEGANYVVERLRASTIEQSACLVGPEGNRPIVVLNACQAGRAGYKLTSIGGFSRAFLRQGAAAFVGALWAVGDRPARVFTETLYEGLLAGDTLSEATIRARNAARAAREATWLAYTVYGNPHARLIQ